LPKRSEAPLAFILFDVLQDFISAAFTAGVPTIPGGDAAYREPDSYVRHRTKVLFLQYYYLIPLSHEVRLLWYLHNVR
jgi:hypothetical protein